VPLAHHPERIPEILRALVVPAYPRGVPQFHARTFRVVLAPLISALASGCAKSGDCEQGQSRCDGHVAMFCALRGDDSDTYLAWNEEDCGAAACATDDGGAFCALDSAPEPDCDGGTGEVCVGATITQCRVGYTTGTNDCATGASSGSFSLALDGPDTPGCVSGDAGVFCVQPFARDPACPRATPDHEPNAACSGNDALQCAYGFAVKRTSCNDLSCECNGTGENCTVASCVAQ
jgi:hypothetical protein